ncbi:MAG: hypothetical protein KF819_27335 [Labilithrix sp.]|nr:hypothetical protein [Labilithrix sp.]
MRVRGTGRIGIVSLVALVASMGCAADFSTNRVTPKRGSLGREMYTMVCDRVGAQALRDDVAGISYHAVCHANAAGEFADTVDVAKLPPLEPAFDVHGKPVSIEQQVANRTRRVAKIEALARRRDDLIAAFDTALANEKVGLKDLENADEAKSCDPPSAPGAATEADIRTELSDMLGRVTDLYNDDTIPHLTRALSRVMNDVEGSPDAQAALARFDARRGYRPTDVSMGVARPALSYPRLVELANALLRLLSNDVDPYGLRAGAPKKKPHERTAADRVAGKGNAALVDMLGILKEELRTAKAIPDAPPLVATPDPRDPTLTKLSRPRGNLELARTILLAQDPAFSVGEPRWIVARDARGVAKVALENGKVPAPFVDLTGPGGGPDGLPDVDDLGRFKTTGGLAPSPFLELGVKESAPRDGAGRALRGSATAYEYVDVSATFLSSLSRDLVPLLDPDPAREHETVMDLLAGFTVVAGRRQDGKDSVRAYDGKQVAYRGYRDDDAPVLDLIHAFGQVLADPTTDDTLALLQQLARDKPRILARLIGAGLRVKEIADRHPEASIPGDSTLWDEMLDVVAKMAAKPKLLEDVIRAFGDPRTQGLATSGAAYMTMRDQLTYDRNNLNGLPFNVTKGRVETLVTPVDRSKADTGWNQSAFQRFLRALHDINGLSICTKPGAVAHIVWNGLPLDFPSFPAQAACFTLGADIPPNPMPLCGMFRIENVGHDLIDAVLGRVKLDIRDDCMRRLVDSPLTGIVGGADAFLEDVSGIKGFNTKPTVPGIARLVYFDLPHDGLPGDMQNAKTRNFLRDLFDPAETLVCPPAPFTDTDGKTLNIRKCSAFKDTVRGRDLDALFPLEQFGFVEAAKPLAQAFYDNDANLLFVDLFDVLHVHWGTNRQSADECNKGAPKSDARWCSQDGAMTYEPLIAEALRSDLFPALLESTRELSTLTIPHCDARDAAGTCTKTTTYDGVKVLAEAVKAMVDPEKNKGLKQRNGDAGVVRNDGTKNTQVTPIYLLIDALKGFDRRLDEHKAKTPGDDRLPQWRRARSQIVDQLFAVQGTGASARLSNPAVEKLLPVLVGALRAQIAANCPDPAKVCAWGRVELPGKASDVVTGPTFATVLDLLDAIRSDAAARTELERLLVFLLQSAQADASKTTLTALVDMLQVFEDDANLTALLHAVSDAAAPETLDESGRVASRGLLLATVEVFARILGEARDANGTRLCKREIDPNRTLAVVLRRLVTAPGDGRPPPIDVLIDVTADVHRREPSVTTKLEPTDYASIAHEVSDFCTHPSRGLEQMYEVIKQATKDL